MGQRRHSIPFHGRRRRRLLQSNRRSPCRPAGRSPSINTSLGCPDQAGRSHPRAQPQPPEFPRFRPARWLRRGASGRRSRRTWRKVRARALRRRGRRASPIRTSTRCRGGSASASASRGGTATSSPTHPSMAASPATCRGCPGDTSSTSTPKTRPRTSSCTGRYSKSARTPISDPSSTRDTSRSLSVFLALLYVCVSQQGKHLI